MIRLTIKKYHLNCLKNMRNGIDLIPFLEFQKQMQLMEKDVSKICESCAKELAARLLAKVIKRTPSDTGTLRRGWTGGVNGNAVSYANSLKVSKNGNSYTIEIINPVEYASYVETGHRTRDHKGWVDGRFMLRISEDEIRSSAPKILENKLKKIFEDMNNGNN